MDLFGEEPEDIKEEIIEEDNAKPESLGHPRTMDFCLGHESVEEKLLELYQADRLPHALIFNGPQGIGKATMAYRLAKNLLGGGTDPQNPAVRRISSGAHPDLMSVERVYDPLKNRYKDAVDVATIRKVTPFLRMTASDGGWRVVIIDDADTMNRNAQNALLKILEEPPKNSLLILVAHRLGALIPTIRSRCHVVHFQPLSSDIIQDLLNKQGYGYSGADLKTLLQLSDGSVGRTVEYIEQDSLETLDRVLKALQTYPSWNWVDLHALADELGRQGQDQSFKAFQDVLALVFGQLAVAKARGQSIEANSTDVGALQDLLKNSSLEQLLKICENLQDHFDKVNTANLDKRQAVLGAFTQIAA